MKKGKKMLKAKLQSGFSPLLILLAVLALLAAGGGAYYFVKMGGSLTPSSFIPTTATRQESAEPSEEVSDSLESGDIEKEIEDTQVDETNSDFAELDSSASGL
jgi:flagellar basal body-associated protein FliL